MRSIAELRPEIEGMRGSFEEQLAALVEIPSVSMEPERRSDLGRCADLAVEYLRGIGAEARRLDTGGPPLVIGKLPGDPSWPTITIYNHLDVQPADPVEWDSPPFKFTREEEPGGPRWFARGTTDDKGPALTAMYGAKLAARDGVQANLQFLWELEARTSSRACRPPGPRVSAPTWWPCPTPSGCRRGGRRCPTVCAA